jgi:hypothetical protein
MRTKPKEYYDMAMAVGKFTHQEVIENLKGAVAAARKGSDMELYMSKVLDHAIAEAEAAAYWRHYEQEQAMLALRDRIRHINNGGDWWAELAHDDKGWYVLANEIAGQDYEHQVRSAEEFITLCERLAAVA